MTIAKKTYIPRGGVTYEELYELAVSRAKEVENLQKQVAEMRKKIVLARDGLKIIGGKDSLCYGQEFRDCWKNAIEYLEMLNDFAWMPTEPKTDTGKEQEPK